MAETFIPWYGDDSERVRRQGKERLSCAIRYKNFSQNRLSYCRLIAWLIDRIQPFLSFDLTEKRADVGTLEERDRGHQQNRRRHRQSPSQGLLSPAKIHRLRVQHLRPSGPSQSRPEPRSHRADHFWYLGILEIEIAGAIRKKWSPIREKSLMEKVHKFIFRLTRFNSEKSPHFTFLSFY